MRLNYILLSSVIIALSIHCSTYDIKKFQVLGKNDKYYDSVRVFDNDSLFVNFGLGGLSSSDSIFGLNSKLYFSNQSENIINIDTVICTQVYKDRNLEIITKIENGNTYPIILCKKSEDILCSSANFIFNINPKPHNIKVGEKIYIDLFATFKIGNHRYQIDEKLIKKYIHDKGFNTW